MSLATMSWKYLKALRCWTPLSEMTDSATPLGNGLYGIGQGQYLIAVPHNERMERDEKGPFVTGLLWAETDGAAKRAKQMEVEADDSRHTSSPPADLLPGNARSYGEIIAALKRQGQSFQEYAEYRVATDGAFVHRTVETGLYSFFFRKVEHDDLDPCYAIQYTLPS
jgi:hypothetical protein